MEKTLGKLEMTLLPIFAKAPHLPQNWKKVMTDNAPWLSLVFGILGFIGLFSAGALGMIFSPAILFGTGLRGILFFITIAFGLGSSVLSILSYSPLSEMKKNGWNYAFYAFVISAASSLINMLFVYNGGGAGSIIGAIFGAYVLFEVRDSYHS
jgi:hypothetical protein